MVAAGVYDARDKLIAGYSTKNLHLPASLATRSTAEDGDLVVTRPVQQGDTRLGTVYLRSSLAPVSVRFARYIVIGLLVVMAAALLLVLGTTQRALLRQREELARANDELRTQISERQRIEEALRQAQKMESIGQLTGGVAHDFNNFLQVIVGNLGIIERLVPRDNGQVHGFIAAAFRGTERAAALTQRLLAFARRQPLNPTAMDVNRLVSDMSQLLRSTLGESIRIETVLGAGLWRISADANQLENALLNLGVNARDAMPNGGKLTVETANVDLDDAYARQNDVRPGQYVMIAVSDTGVGMTKDVVAKAFEPFFTTKEVGKGSGLGLSQVYGFVKQSNGHAKIYSEPGHGTTIKLYFPRLVTQEEVATSTQESAGTANASRHETILVVEDDDDVRATTVGVLRAFGYAVIEAEGGPKALATLERNPDIDLLFTDVGLPGMNGRELADAARKKHPHLKVLFTTGYARNAIVHQGRLDPGVELITKPFTEVSLAAKIEQVLRAGPA
jgi:signal transduction histidine kinase/CheY-like chemotaxis protein